jgi:uncharacterized membrane protein
VGYTKYKLDDGAWITYTTAFLVSTNGKHTVFFYSVDKSGNKEMEKNSTFTIQKEVPQVNITIQGGLGISATITNTGTTTLTNISWTIALDGKLIFLGKTKNDTIATLEAGDSVTVRDFVIGFGKTGIKVKVESAEANTTGTVILFFVVGVK